MFTVASKNKIDIDKAKEIIDKRIQVLDKNK